jgi:hypothetical protein
MSACESIIPDLRLARLQKPLPGAVRITGGEQSAYTLVLSQKWSFGRIS